MNLIMPRGELQFNAGPETWWRIGVSHIHSFNFVTVDGRRRNGEERVLCSVGLKSETFCTEGWLDAVSRFPPIDSPDISYKTLRDIATPR
jgi:hypothetical protein